MAQRRADLIEASLSLLLEGRGDSFTLRQVAKKAKVSLTVLYASFGSKEGLVAAAVRTFYSRQPQSRRRSATDLPGLLREVDEATEITLAYPTYVRSLCELYFLHDGRNEVFEEINTIARDTFLPWLTVVEEKGDLSPAVPRAIAEQLIASDRWHAISEWMNGRTSADQLPAMIKLRFLILCAGMTQGETRREIMEAMHIYQSKRTEFRLA